MDAAAPVGTSMIGALLAAIVLAAGAGASPAPTCSAIASVQGGLPRQQTPQRFALIVSGASGGQDYAQQYNQWTAELSTALVERLKFDRSRVTVLSETDRADAAANADNVRRVLASYRGRVNRDDVLLLVLIGHGTFDGVDAKFNLVGPDLESAEWSSLLSPLAGRIVLVNTTSASFPFLERAAGPRRIVITATDSVAQRFDTVFPQYFIKALTDEAADLDKNGRVSIWEAFAAASNSVRRYYQQQGQLATERPLLDDNGDGIGKEVTVRATTDRWRADLSRRDHGERGAHRRRADKAAAAQDLARGGGRGPEDSPHVPAPGQCAQEFERIMVELAKVSATSAPGPRPDRTAHRLRTEACIPLQLSRRRVMSRYP